MQRLRAWIVFVLVLFGVPAAGWIAGAGLSVKIEDEFLDAVMSLPQVANQRLTRGDVIQFSAACRRADLRSALGAQCETYEHLQLLQSASLWSAIGALAIIALVWGTARLCRNNRSLLARAFGI